MKELFNFVKVGFLFSRLEGSLNIDLPRNNEVKVLVLITFSINGLMLSHFEFSHMSIELGNSLPAHVSEEFNLLDLIDILIF